MTTVRVHCQHLTLVLSNIYILILNTDVTLMFKCSSVPRPRHLHEDEMSKQKPYIQYTPAQEIEDKIHRSCDIIVLVCLLISLLSSQSEIV